MIAHERERKAPLRAFGRGRDGDVGFGVAGWVERGRKVAASYGGAVHGHIQLRGQSQQDGVFGRLDRRGGSGGQGDGDACGGQGRATMNTIRSTSITSLKGVRLIAEVVRFV